MLVRIISSAATFHDESPFAIWLPMLVWFRARYGRVVWQSLFVFPSLDQAILDQAINDQAINVWHKLIGEIIVPCLGAHPDMPSASEEAIHHPSRQVNGHCPVAQRRERPGISRCSRELLTASMEREVMPGIIPLGHRRSSFVR